jgi:type II secretory pathway component GspD/PulD (secretin)
MKKRILLVILFYLFVGQSNLFSGEREKILQYLQQGEYFYKRGNYDQAIGEFNKVLEISPHNRIAQVYLEKAKLKEERQRKLAELKAKKETERKNRLEEIARRKEELRKRYEELQAKREAERKSKEERKAKLKEERQRKLAELKAKKETELKAKQEQLARKREELLQKKRELKTKREQELRAKQKVKEELAQLKAKIIEEKQKKIAEKKKNAEIMLEKHRQDQTKIEKIEELWRQAKMLYNKGMYEEAIRDFEKIIELEGNPRIKYTPYAKEYIKKAKEKMRQKAETELFEDVKRIEEEMIQEVIKRQKPPYIEPPQRKEEIKEVPLVEIPPIRKKLREKKITLDFEKVDLKSVLLFLSQETNVNFVASQKVLDSQFKVTARFQEASAEEVIKYITKSLGLIYRFDKEIVWIAHPEEIATEPMETRIYYLTKGGGLFTEFTPITATTAAAAETGLGGSAATISKVSTIEETLKEAIPWPADAKLIYDKRLNALIARNTPQNLQLLEDLLYSMDITPCQVLIEARFLEVDITDIEELGLEWKFATEDFAVETKGRSFKHGFAKDSGVDFSTFSRAAEGLNLTYKGVLTAPQFESVLHALEETKKSKILSSPRITTLNNQLATIKIVDEWIYPTRYEYQIVQYDLNGDGDYNDAGETTYKNVPMDFLRRDVGILLKVIPSVGADKKTINLSLIPEVSEATADAFTYTGDVKLPKFTSRNLSTTVVVNSGDTVVLGGLIKESRTKTLTKVPLFGDLPVLGVFFRKNTDSIQRKNLLIFVTAKVLSSSGEEVIVKSNL